MRPTRPIGIGIHSGRISVDHRGAKRSSYYFRPDDLNDQITFDGAFGDLGWFENEKFGDIGAFGFPKITLPKFKMPNMWDLPIFKDVATAGKSVAVGLVLGVAIGAVIGYKMG